MVQEVKLLAKKEDRIPLDSAIDELVQLGMQREMAAESIFKERCIGVNDGSSWAKYMSISGSPCDKVQARDLCDVKAVMKDSGTAMLGVGVLSSS